MGGGNSKEKSQVDVFINHPKFTQAKILSQNEKRTLQTTMGVDQKSYKTWSKILQSTKLNSQFLMLPIKHHFATKGLCGTTGTLTLDFQNYPQILTEEIDNRKGKKSRFEETELWLLLYSLIAAKRDFSVYNLKVGDIRPQNVFLSEQNKIKVVNSLSWPQQDSNVQKAFNKEKTYLSPEQLKGLDIGQINELQNQMEPELFSIGLTVLSAGILTDMSDLYNLNNMSLNYGLLAERLNFWKHTPYSVILRGTILNLCQLQPSKRIKTIDFTNWIDKHSQPIKQLKNFTIADAPAQLHTSVQEMLAQLGQVKTPPQAPLQPIAKNFSFNPAQHANFAKSQIKPDIRSQFKPQIRHDIPQAMSMYTPIPSNINNQGYNPNNIKFNSQQGSAKKQTTQLVQQKLESNKQVQSPKK